MIERNLQFSAVWLNAYQIWCNSTNFQRANSNFSITRSLLLFCFPQATLDLASETYATAHDRCLKYFREGMLPPLAPRRAMCLSALLLHFSFFSAFLSCADAHSWIEAVTHVRDNTPFGKIGYARGNGPQFPVSP